MKLIGNVLWFLLGGALLALLWAAAGLICMVTVVGIPLGIQCFKFAHLVLVPFGRTVVYGEKIVSFIVNMLWLLLFGWELALIAFVIGLLWMITVVGIPFGLQFMKFAKLALMPFGAKIVKA